MKCLLLSLLAASARASHLPKVVHQTVSDKNNISCEARETMGTWRALNPGYEHRIWDDADIRAFVVKNHPDLIPHPFDDYLTGTERADVFRVLVMLSIGGVYADSDTRCLKPIDEWPFTKRAMLGVEYYSDRGDDPKLLNWALASQPGHLLFRIASRMFKNAIIREFFERHQRGTHPTLGAYRDGILGRTGPLLLNEAVNVYATRQGAHNLSLLDRERVDRGHVMGSVHILSQHAFGQSCSQGAGGGGRLLCHEYWGQWKLDGRKRVQPFSYDCNS